MKRRMAVGLVAVPFIAQAGMPSMWGILCCHLLCGNLLLGLVAAFFLGRYCRAKKRGCLAFFLCALLMAFANCISFAALLAVVPEALMRLSLDRVLEWLLPMYLCLTVMACLVKMAIELPFVYCGIRLSGGDRSARGVLKTSLVVQSVSFALLVLYYAALGEWSLLSIKVVDSRDMDLPDGVVVKYVAEDGKGMCLDPQTGQTAEDDADAICQASLRDYPEEVRHVGGTNGVWRASVYSTDGGGCNERIDCHNSKTGRNFSIGLQTPFCCLFIDDVTMLPDGKVVFKLDDLIVAADPECNRIAVLAHGKCPVAEKRECQK